MNTPQKYQEVAKLLTERLLGELKDQIHSIVLFGSVARGDATEDSDIDILIIMDAPFPIRQRIDKISYYTGMENGAITEPIFLTSQAFETEAIKYRSYFASDVITQGIVLYDDGTFRRIYEKASSAFSGIPGR